MRQSAIQDHFHADHALCYGCGSHNPHGLHIRTHWDGRFGTCRFTPKAHYRAFPGVVYGGLIASLFDCHCIGTAIAAAYHAEGRQPGMAPAIMFVTANLNVNYLQPTPMGHELLLKAHVVESANRKSVIACTLTQNGNECANARVVAVRVT